MAKEIKIPVDKLDFFETLDLDNKLERRAGMRVIVDFYGELLSEIGTTYLDFKPDDLSQGVGPLWRKARGRLQSIQDIDIPEQYDSVINRLHNEQNEVDHHFQTNPKKDLLIEAHRCGNDWAIWLKNSAKTYEEAVGQQSAQETMVRLAQQSLDVAQRPPDSLEYSDLSDEQAEINDRIEQKFSKIESIADTTDTISNELVFTFADAISLEQESESLVSEFYQRKEKEERLSGFREYENTTAYYVTDPYDEDDPGKPIIMVSDVVGEEDRTISVDPHHPDIPEDTRDKLMELDVNTRYTITFSYDRHNDRYIQKIRR